MEDCLIATSDMLNQTGNEVLGQVHQVVHALEEACGEKFPAGDQLHTQETNEFLKRILKKMKVECSAPQTNARMLDKLVASVLDELANQLVKHASIGLRSRALHLPHA
jgi:hypothetical protein